MRKRPRRSQADCPRERAGLSILGYFSDNGVDKKTQQNYACLLAKIVLTCSILVNPFPHKICITC